MSHRCLVGCSAGVFNIITGSFYAFFRSFFTSCCFLIHFTLLWYLLQVNWMPLIPPPYVKKHIILSLYCTCCLVGKVWRNHLPPKHQQHHACPGVLQWIPDSRMHRVNLVQNHKKAYGLRALRPQPSLCSCNP